MPDAPRRPLTVWSIGPPGGSALQPPLVVCARAVAGTPFFQTTNMTPPAERPRTYPHPMDEAALAASARINALYAAGASERVSTEDAAQIERVEAKNKLLWQPRK